MKNFLKKIKNHPGKTGSIIYLLFFVFLISFTQPVVVDEVYGDTAKIRILGFIPEEVGLNKKTAELIKKAEDSISGFDNVDIKIKNRGLLSWQVKEIKINGEKIK